MIELFPTIAAIVDPEQLSLTVPLILESKKIVGVLSLVTLVYDVIEITLSDENSETVLPPDKTLSIVVLISG